MINQEGFNKIVELIKSKLQIENLELEFQFDIPTIVVPKNKLHDTLALLKNDTTTNFNFLTTLCGIQFPDESTDREFAMMYQIHNLQNNDRIRIRCYMAESDMNVPTVTDLWKAANWLERETFDFFGFIFTGHPNLKRITNMDEMNYHPMRKQYALEDAGRTDKDDKYFGR